MRKLILLLIIFSTSLFAQPKSEKVVIKKIANNVIELRAKLYGNFKELEGLTKAERTIYLGENYSVGFLFENYRQLGWEIPQKPMGDHKFRENLNGKDTLIIITDLTNAPIGVNYYVETYFKPKSEKYKFRLDGTEAIGDKLQDFLCEVADVRIDKKMFADKNDTVTVTSSVTMEEGCSQTLTYNWKFRTYNQVIDTIATDTYDTSYVYSAWKNWNSNRNGYISADKDLVFQVMSKKWNKRQWTVYVDSGVGKAKKSNNFTLRVNQ